MLRKPCQANPSLKLTMELVPLTAWGQNLRSNIKWSQWDKLRKYTFEEHEGACAICGAARGYLICHEVWEYDDKRHVQRLITLRPLCWMCDRVKHFGNTEMLILKGVWRPNLLDRLIRHFMRVNRCDRETFERHKKEAYEKWGKRSRHEWKLDFGNYKELVT